jgi:hypothetical protein
MQTGLSGMVRLVGKRKRVKALATDWTEDNGYIASRGMILPFLGAACRFWLVEYLSNFHR